MHPLRQLTLTAARASNGSKSSSLYKSAGGAITSLLNQFVDESYYRGDSASSSLGNPRDFAATSASRSIEMGNTGEAEPLRCAVGAFATVLRDIGSASSLRVLGLARTGITKTEASKLSRGLRRRSTGSPLEHVEVRDLSRRWFDCLAVVEMRCWISAESSSAAYCRGGSQGTACSSRGFQLSQGLEGYSR